MSATVVMARAGANTEGAEKAAQETEFKKVLSESGREILAGSAGADRIQGGDAKERLEGSDGADTLKGGNGNDVLRGGKGDDLLKGGRGNDKFHGGDGTDTAVFYGKRNDYDVVDLGDKVQVIHKETGETDTLFGVEQIGFNGGRAKPVAVTDVAKPPAPSGEKGADVLVNGQTISVPPVVLPGVSPEVMESVPTVDEMPWARPAPLSVLTPEDTAPPSVLTPLDTSPEPAPRPSPAPQAPIDQTINGSFSGDRLRGTDFNDRIRGLGGNDLLSGGAGDDILVGGYGNDRIYGGTGRDMSVHFGPSTDYSVTRVDAGSVSVRNLRTGETDLLSGVERLNFSDGIFQLGDILSG